MSGNSTPSNPCHIVIEEDDKGNVSVSSPDGKGIDLAWATGAKDSKPRTVYWLVENKTGSDRKVELDFTKKDFYDAFKPNATTPPPREYETKAKVKRVAIPLGTIGTGALAYACSKAHKPAKKGLDLTYRLMIDDNEIDPGLRIDNGKNFVFSTAALVALLVVSLLAGFALAGVLLFQR